jgi:hypothetical protein
METGWHDTELLWCAISFWIATCETGREREREKERALQKKEHILFFLMSY